MIDRTKALDTQRYMGIKNKTLKEFKQCVMGCDVSKASDYSAIIVFEVTAYGARIVYSDRRVTQTMEEWKEWVKQVQEKYNVNDNFKIES